MEIHAHINSWARGHVDPWWSLENLALPYVNEPFNDQVALNEWTKLGYTQTKFTGDMYDMRSPEPVWINPFRKVFPLSNFSWSIYRMGPGTVLPEHTDTYSRFKKVYRIKEHTTIMRAIVFLQDWDSGHYLEMNGEPVIKWRAGDWVIWSDQFPHLAANMGKTNRYTLQITGT
jgi:hypothetical protein